MTKPRDYKAEYARRIERGLARGLSRSQARGHPGIEELHASNGSNLNYDPRLEEGLRAMIRGKPLREAAREAHVAPERLRRYVGSSEFAKKKGGRWTFEHDQIVRDLLIYSDAQALTMKARGSETASRIGRYMNAVRRFLNTNDPRFLAPFRGDVVKDTRGHKHVLETRENVLYQLAETGDATFEQVYKIVV